MNKQICVCNCNICTFQTKKYSKGTVVTLNNNIGFIQMIQTKRVFLFNLTNEINKNEIKEGSKVIFFKSWKKVNNKTVLTAINIQLSN
jgi:hypothetical protein